MQRACRDHVDHMWTTFTNSRGRVVRDLDVFYIYFYPLVVPLESTIRERKGGWYNYPPPDATDIVVHVDHVDHPSVMALERDMSVVRRTVWRERCSCIHLAPVRGAEGTGPGGAYWGRREVFTWYLPWQKPP